MERLGEAAGCTEGCSTSISIWLPVRTGPFFLLPSRQTNERFRSPQTPSVSSPCQGWTISRATTEGSIWQAGFSVTRRSSNVEKSCDVEKRFESGPDSSLSPVWRKLVAIGSGIESCSKYLGCVEVPSDEELTRSSLFYP